MLNRRSFMALSGAALAAPALAQGSAARTLKFIPQADLTVLDPIWTTAYVTRNHGLAVFDTLYGTDARYAAQPQMVAGHTVENDDKLWRLTLRPGLTFHDGSPVLARDCVASIARWGKRDAMGQTLMAYTDELSAPDDRTIQFRLKKPFALLPEALGKVGSSICAIMPERLAKTDPFTQVTEMVGSGPFRFKADERVVGARVVYERFAGYVPREGGEPQWTSGPKRVFVDRVEWHVIPDQATAASAMQTGEMDWWEQPPADLVPTLGGLTTRITDPTGLIGCLRMNQLQPPFDNPAIRQVLLKVVDQTDFMQAVTGTDPKLIHVPTGFFCPGLPMASDVGLDVLTSKRDYEAAKTALAAAGYKGEKVVLMGASDFPSLKALADVAADMLTRAGFNVDYQVMDWGSVVQRRAKKDPIAQGGWSAFCTFWAGLDQANPAVSAFLRGTGQSAAIGWPTSEKIEALRDQWLDAPDTAARKQLAGALQRQAFTDLPYLPLGQYFNQTSYKPSLTGVLDGVPMFWNVKKG
ncbi:MULTISPECIES: ABC transporter substrate-binding protein [Methylobacterium]|jgi:peptide/nickel transport system substrate-binding protein|uniref:Peptide ABC transporter periplasmic-binding protein y4tO n=2 Tax=Methylobacterium TaxID=407 RepID=A0AAE8HX04_9HYPH|nr:MULTISPECIES: ABC transporter substrate-binding protein [Methylobacterium]KOX41845.1 ABC transporter substrate-binding protein [Streptomyces purpurogeneiscleroticus]APT33051.1 putative peptide ABC transporter periplasmic-binding protein y4tO [Methylobacterium phyllosphaerae]AWV15823.1 ABC transporter substrate-binding protein [Methylobacterium sp. XJLW]MDH3031224.1 ABC transporter substrate-binding protein [Methylobacterium fujisawaense]RUP12777.1 MAG: ABC transporter substrate-binding prot